MINLIRAADAADEIAEAVAEICGESYREGPLGELTYISEVIKKYVTAKEFADDPDHEKLWDVLGDTRFTPQERARRFLDIR